MTKIQILTGSTRPGRFNIQPARWIQQLAQERKEIDVELLDLAEINLPFLDEAVPPAMGQYSQEHTKKWSQKIAEGDGFVFVTPEYNHSYSAVLKNAVDYLFQEWHYKPVAFISYGSTAAGSRAVEHLRSVAAEVKMYDLREQVLLPNYWEHLNQEGLFDFDEHHHKLAQSMLDSLIFWAKQMKESRKKLAA